MIREKSCGAVVYRTEPQQNLFLIEHMWAGHFSMPKGHVEEGETEAQTAMREIREETGLKVYLNESFREVITFSPYPDCLKDVVFFLALAEQGEAVPQPSEIRGLLWLPLEEALNTLTFESDREVLRKAADFLKNMPAQETAACPETEHLRLGKARMEDWESMWKNVWSRPACARYMYWDVTETEEEARDRMRRTVEYQRLRPDAWLIYEKASGLAIGYTGLRELEPGVLEETGICIGEDYFRRGYGREILRLLIRTVRERDFKEFLLYVRQDNTASRQLIRSEGLPFWKQEEVTWQKDGSRVILETYRLLPE